MSDTERLKRWRLILGGEEADGIGCALSAEEGRMDEALSALYGGAGAEGARGRDAQARSAGLGASAPRISRWLGDIRTYFPTPVVKVMQQDAIERLNLKQLLFEPEVLATVEADVHLVATLMSLKHLMPERTRDTARQVVARVVDEVRRRLEEPMRAAVMGSLARSVRNYRPRHNEIDWPRTIRANLKHYQPEYRTIIPERRIGFGRKRQSLKDILLLVDQSGSMGPSVVYSSIFGAVLASLPAVSTRIIAFDTAVVDLSDELGDPVEVLFGIQLGGGTDINRALGYAQGLIRRPADTVCVLISDLYEGGNQAEMLKRAQAMVASGVLVIALLALSDDGAPSYDRRMAAEFAKLGIPSFACTPDQFPELLATALKRGDVSSWAASQGIVVSRGAGGGE